MNSSVSKTLLEWYGEHCDNHFDLQDELLKYCISDVDTLQRVCVTFREIFFHVTNGIEPFEISITIASGFNLMYRTMFLKENQVAFIPPHGYYLGNNNHCFNMAHHGE